MASFQSHRLRHMTAQQGPNLTHLTFLCLITYISSSGWGPLGVVLSHRKSYIIIAFHKIVILSQCWRICPNNTAKDNRDYKEIKKLHLGTHIFIPFIFSGEFRYCLPELGNNFSVSPLVCQQWYSVSVLYQPLWKYVKEVKYVILVLSKFIIKVCKIHLWKKFPSPKYLFSMFFKPFESIISYHSLFVSLTPTTQQALYKCLMNCTEHLF